MKLTAYLLFLYGLLALPAYPQIGIGGQPHPSAVLDLKSPANDKAFYPPRLTTAQRKAIVNPQVGAFVYDLDKGALYMFDGQNWSPLAFTTTNSLAPIDRTANDGAAGDFFGYGVAISGDYAIVGAYSNDIGANINQGAAYIFTRTGGTWIQQAKLIANDGASGDVFGSSVAISGDYALVGAYNDDIGANADQGSAYVFVRSGSTWAQQAKLTANDGATNDYFGTNVAISGDYAIVGAYSDDVGANTDQGSAYVFVRNGSSWTQQAQLTANDGAANDIFGLSVAVSGDYAIVGASGDDIGTKLNQGSAYVFVRNSTNWTQQAKLTASTFDGSANDYFGSSVAISGDYAIVGVYNRTNSFNGNSGQGAAFVFVRAGSSWTQQSFLTADDGAVGDFFGSSVAISGDYAIVGAYNNDIGANTNQGSAYVFVRNGSSWRSLRTISDNSTANTQNGLSVGLSNGVFIIGGPGFESGKGKVSFGAVEN